MYACKRAKVSQIVVQEYSKKTRPHPGVFSVPEGGDYYRACLDWHLSLAYSPKQLHDIGLEEVEWIKSKMEAVNTLTTNRN